jgi:hypothetical protein
MPNDQYPLDEQQTGMISALDKSLIVGSPADGMSFEQPRQKKDFFKFPGNNDEKMGGFQ